jgi:cytochrome c-type biogenesis protein CcmE
MKTRYIVGGIVIIGFLVIAFFSLVRTDIEYADFNKAAAKPGKKVQVKGQWIREKGTDYSADKNEFSFYMKDENGSIAKIVFKGAKPNNFDIASHVVATGKLENTVFYASEILTKCPSKYEGKQYSE